MPNPKRSRAGQVIIRSHQRLIDLAIDFLQEDDHNGVPDLVSDDDDQESINGTPNFGVQDDGRSNKCTTSTLWLFQMRSSG